MSWKAGQVDRSLSIMERFLSLKIRLGVALSKKDPTASRDDIIDIA
jgi:hypothetical protein